MRVHPYPPAALMLMLSIYYYSIVQPIVCSTALDLSLQHCFVVLHHSITMLLRKPSEMFCTLTTNDSQHVQIGLPESEQAQRCLLALLVQQCHIMTVHLSNVQRFTWCVPTAHCPVWFCLKYEIKFVVVSIDLLFGIMCKVLNLLRAWDACLVTQFAFHLFGSKSSAISCNLRVCV